MALVSDSWDKLKSIVESLNTYCCDMGLTISCSKEEILEIVPSASFRKPQPTVLHPGECPVVYDVLLILHSIVQRFQQLGSIVQDDCNTIREVEPRISRVSHAFHSLFQALWFHWNIMKVLRSAFQGGNSASSTIWLAS